MEDEPETSPPAPAPPSAEEKAEAEDTTPQDAPAEPADDPDHPDESVSEPEEEPSAPRDDAPRSASQDLPRTTTTGDDAEDVRAAGDGAVSAVPGDDLDDSAQRHD